MARDRGVPGQTYLLAKGHDLLPVHAPTILLIGPPGAGKTMLCKRLPTILPPLMLAESLETTRIHSSAGQLKPGQSLTARRPVRAPHHSASGPALVDGGVSKARAVRPDPATPPSGGLVRLQHRRRLCTAFVEQLRAILGHGLRVCLRSPVPGLARRTTWLPAGGRRRQTHGCMPRNVAGSQHPDPLPARPVPRGLTPRASLWSKRFSAEGSIANYRGRPLASGPKNG